MSTKQQRLKSLDKCTEQFSLHLWLGHNTADRTPGGKQTAKPLDKRRRCEPKNSKTAHPA